MQEKKLVGVVDDIESMCRNLRANLRVWGDHPRMIDEGFRFILRRALSARRTLAAPKDAESFLAIVQGYETRPGPVPFFRKAGESEDA